MLSFNKKVLNFGFYTKFKKYFLGVQPKSMTNTCKISLLAKNTFEIVKYFEIENAERFWGSNNSEDEFYYVDYDCNLHKFNEFGIDTIFLKNIYFYGNWDSEGKIQFEDKQKEQICIFDTNTNEIVEIYSKYKGISPIFFGNYVIYHLYLDKKIVMTDKTASFLSEFPFSNISNLSPALQASWEVWHFVEVVEGVLWIDLSSGVLPNGYVMGGLLGLDVQTGNIRHFLYEPIQMNKATEGNFWFLPQYGHTVYEAEKKCLAGLFHQNYYVIDLQTSSPVLKMWSLEDEFNKYDVALANANNMVMDKEYIYFVGTNHLGNIRSKICALNRHTLVLDWVYDFGADFLALLGRIEVNETHLFVLDSKGTLHIFEKESE